MYFYLHCIESNKKVTKMYWFIFKYFNTIEYKVIDKNKNKNEYPFTGLITSMKQKKKKKMPFYNAEQVNKNLFS